MLVLVSGATATMRRLNDPRFGRLIVPAARNRPETLDLLPCAWGMDSGAYGDFKLGRDFRPGPFIKMLEQFSAYPGCLFVAAPDVVENARATLDSWLFWSRLIRAAGYPPALVAQDGLTSAQVPWDELEALFIGGSTEWKDSTAALTLAAYAKARGLWVHWGRVSTLRRLRNVRRVGDSLDTSGNSKYPDEMAGRFQRWLTRFERQPELTL